MYDQPVKDATAFVLAGGKSSRMGTDKALLAWGGGTLLSHMVQMAGRVASTVHIVGQSEKFSSLGTVVEDLFRDCGPLGGIHAALSTTSSDLNLILAVDLPFLSATFLEFLLAKARETDALVTVPRTDGRWQPLCAVYRRGFAGLAEQSLSHGKYKIDPLFATVKTRVIDESELGQAGFSTEIFRNVNTPEEFNEAREKTANPDHRL